MHPGFPKIFDVPIHSDAMEALLKRFPELGAVKWRKGERHLALNIPRTNVQYAILRSSSHAAAKKTWKRRKPMRREAESTDIIVANKSLDNVKGDDEIGGVELVQEEGSESVVCSTNRLDDRLNVRIVTVRTIHHSDVKPGIAPIIIHKAFTDSMKDAILTTKGPSPSNANKKAVQYRYQFRRSLVDGYLKFAPKPFKSLPQNTSARALEGQERETNAVVTWPFNLPTRRDRSALVSSGKLWLSLAAFCEREDVVANRSVMRFSLGRSGCDPALEGETGDGLGCLGLKRHSAPPPPFVVLMDPGIRDGTRVLPQCLMFDLQYSSRRNLSIGTLLGRSAVCPALRKTAGLYMNSDKNAKDAPPGKAFVVAIIISTSKENDWEAHEGFLASQIASAVRSVYLGFKRSPDTIIFPPHPKTFSDAMEMDAIPISSLSTVMPVVTVDLAPGVGAAFERAGFGVINDLVAILDKLHPNSSHPHTTTPPPRTATQHCECYPNSDGQKCAAFSPFATTSPVEAFHKLIDKDQGLLEVVGSIIGVNPFGQETRQSTHRGGKGRGLFGGAVLGRVIDVEVGLRGRPRWVKECLAKLKADKGREEINPTQVPNRYRVRLTLPYDDSIDAGLIIGPLTRHCQLDQETFSALLPILLRLRVCAAGGDGNKTEPGWISCDVRTAECECLWAVWRGRGGRAAEPCKHVVAVRMLESRYCGGKERERGHVDEREEVEFEDMVSDGSAVTEARELLQKIRAGMPITKPRRSGTCKDEAEYEENQKFLEEYRRFGDKIFYQEITLDNELSMDGEAYYWNH
ncbi:hypothetical protein HDU67_006273 [Dinochytrium kinnereticum]|nr:hypothetical protein HDU67_006273 [Dinochytrium kinnereticum]